MQLLNAVNKMNDKDFPLPIGKLGNEVNNIHDIVNTILFLFINTAPWLLTMNTVEFSLIDYKCFPVIIFVLVNYFRLYDYNTIETRQL